MSSYTTSITPRLRVARNSSFSYDRSISQIATATEGGPSRLPDLSRLVDMKLDDMSTSQTSDQPSTFNVPTPATPNRSETPAAHLRSLISRLSTEPKNLSIPRRDSQEYLSERESDYDMDLTEPANAAPSMVQESVKDIFSKARREPGDTPQKTRSKSISDDSSEVRPPSTVYNERNVSKGKRQSLSDDEMENPHPLSHRPATRFKYSPQPITAEFLRERFSESRILPESAEEDDPHYLRELSNDAGAISGEMSSFQTNLPVATSTPQQSLSMSFNSQFQSNLLDQDTEMQHAINDLISDGESSPNCSTSPPPLHKRALSRTELLTPVTSDVMEDASKTPRAPRGIPYSARLTVESGDWDQTRSSNSVSNHAHKMTVENDEATPRRDHIGPSSSHFLSTPSSNSISTLEIGSSRKGSKHSDLRTSPQGTNLHRHRSRPDSPSVSPVTGHDTELADTFRESEQKWNTTPAWNTPPMMRSRSTSPPSRFTDTHLKGDSPRSLHHSDENNNQSQYLVLPDDTPDLYLDPAKEEEARDRDLPQSSFKSSQKSGYNTKRSSSLQSVENTYHHTDPALRHSSRTPSPLPSSPLAPATTSKRARLSTSSSPRKLPISAFSNVPRVSRSVQDLSQYKQPNRSSRIRSAETHASQSDEEDRCPASPSRIMLQPSKGVNVPRVSGEEQPPAKIFETNLLSPSTPPLRQTPNIIQNTFRPRSPVDDALPSSENESDHRPWHPTATPTANTNGGPEHSWFPTPKPPGGWLQTPIAPRATDFEGNLKKSSMPLDNDRGNDDETPEPKTPAKAMNLNEVRYLAKTPRPPGGWHTPAPPSFPRRAQFQTPSERQEDEQDRGLFTPGPSLSKGSLYDPKTPFIPGAWTATPAARKSALKVRFNHETELSSTEKAPGPGLRNGESVNENVDARSPSPRSPRRVQTPNIRIMDAFGREQADDNPFYPEESVDRKVQNTEQLVKDKTEDEVPGLSRRELLSRIRQGFDDLVEDIEDSERDHETQVIDQARVNELNALSIQARKNRQRLLEQAVNLRVNYEPSANGDVLSKSFDAHFAHSRRKYIYIILMQIFLGLLMYRLSVIRAKSLFLSSYYDPFNPELYLYIFKHDTSFRLINADFSRTSQQSIGQALLEEGTRAWFCFLHFIGDVFSYFWTMWAGDAATQATAWSPT